MSQSAFQKAVLSILKDAFTARRFRSYKNTDFSLIRGTTLAHNTATLTYIEGAKHFDIITEEDVDGGFLMDMAEMAAQSPGYSILSHPEQTRIAKNIRTALISKGFPCLIIDNHRPVE